MQEKVTNYWHNARFYFLDTYKDEFFMKMSSYLYNYDMIIKENLII